MELESLSADYLSLMSSAAPEAALFSDVTFCVEGRQLHAHRCILASRCHFFRLMFAHHYHDPCPSSASSPPPIASHSSAAGRPSGSLVVPLDVVGFDAFLALLRFLYSAQLILSPPCPLPACPHSSCSYTIDLLLQLIPAAHFFGVHQLADLVQTKLGNVLEEGVSMESLTRVLVMAKKHKMQRLWHACVDLVISAGVDCSVLRRFLPREVIADLAETRLQRLGCIQNNMQIYDHVHPLHNLISNPSSCSLMCTISAGACCGEEQKILRLQQALDCMDVELVRLMVMGEGLNLDKALALHYSVANCNRDVVKALLELGVVNVNYSDSLGRTALHLAADMGNAEMIAVLLDHHADPNVLTHDGVAAVDILRGLIKVGSQDIHFHHDQHPPVLPPLCKADQKRIHLCIELLQSAAAVAGRDQEAAESSCITQAAVQIFNKNLNQEAVALMSHSPVGLIAGAGIPVSHAGLGLLESGKAAMSIRDDQLRNSTIAARSSQLDSISCPLHLISNDHMQPIIRPHVDQELALESSPVNSISPRAVISKQRHSAASTSSSGLNHSSNHICQISPQINRISEINEKSSSLINPRAVNQNLNHGLYLANASYTGGYQDLQSSNHGDGKSMKASTGSSSEE